MLVGEYIRIVGVQKTGVSRCLPDLQPTENLSGKHQSGRRILGIRVRTGNGCGGAFWSVAMNVVAGSKHCWAQKDGKYA